jgi:hypothetical protein
MEDVAAALDDLARRAPHAVDLSSLPPAWREPLADLARQLHDLDPDYRLERLSWRFGSLNISVEHTQLACCERAHADWDWDAEHWSTESDQHRIERERLDDRSDRTSRLCEHAGFASRHWGEPQRPEPADLRPVVALDIDGVLNPVAPHPLPRFEINGEWFVNIAGMIVPAGGPGSAPSVREGLSTAVVNVPAGLSTNPFFAGARRDITVEVRFDPTVIEWVRGLHDRAEVVWATTWEAAANLFADAVGLPHARVGCSSEAHPPRFGYVKDGDAAAWKADALAQVFDNRPLVWIDDLGARAAANHYWRHPDDVERTLVVVPVEHVGITAEQMEAVDTFIDHHSSRGSQ